MFGLFAKKDPICGMKAEKNKGISKYGEWFCSEQCFGQYERAMKAKEKERKKGCCH